MPGLSVPGRYQPRSPKNAARARFWRERKRALFARIPGGLKAINDAQSTVIQQMLAAEWELALLQNELEKHRRIVMQQNHLVLRLNIRFDKLTTPKPVANPPETPPETIDQLSHRVLAERTTPMRRRAG